MKIYPSLISSDILALRSVLQSLNNNSHGYHLDIMDDHFVPNLTWGPAFVNAIVQETCLPLQIHLMVDNPHTWLSRLSLTAKDSFIFHYEAVNNVSGIQKLIKEVQDKKIRVGIALNPATKVDVLEHVIASLDEVLIMSVNPGFSGQKFIDVTDKVLTLRKMREKNNYSFVIAMDGGITRDNVGIVKRAGVDIIGVASAIFFQSDYVKALQDLQMCIQKA